MAYEPTKSEELKKELQEKVISLAENFKQNPLQMIEYLKFSSQFYGYSPRNCQLAYIQNPGARYLGSFKAFNDKGYTIKKGEHGMKILVPTYKTYLKIGDSLIPLSKANAEQKKLYKENKLETEKKLFFKVGTVFDIAQTTCPVENYPKYFDLGYPSEQHALITESLKKFCEEKLHCPVRESEYNSVSLRGYYRPDNNSISLSGMFDDTTKLSILSHETGHAMLHNYTVMQSARPRPEAQIEFEADAVSIMLHTHLGLEVSESRIRHIADCYKSMSEIKSLTKNALNESLDRAHNAFKQVADYINQNMPPALQLTQNQQEQPQVQTTGVQPQQPMLPNQIPDMSTGSINFGM